MTEPLKLDRRPPYTRSKRGRVILGLPEHAGRPFGKVRYMRKQYRHLRLDLPVQDKPITPPTR